MVSMDDNIDRFMTSQEDARRLVYLRQISQANISGPRDEALTVRRGPLDLGASHHQLQQRIRFQTLNKRTETASGPTSAVSRRNARERKRVRLVNLGFSTLRERVPPGTKNKKLSKVETLRAAIEYIRQLQTILGLPDNDSLIDENFGPDDSSVASSEEVTVYHQSAAQASLSPASSHPSDLMSSPYAPPHTSDDQLLDMGVWFS